MIVKIKELEKEVIKMNFDIPDYIEDEIKNGKSYENICSLIDLAVISNRITKENANILKNKIYHFRDNKICKEELIEVKDELGQFYCQISVKTSLKKEYASNIIRKIFMQELECEGDFVETFEKRVKEIREFSEIKFIYDKFINI